MSSRIIFLVLLSLTIITRFYKLDWGQGLFFHPDENNMAYAISGLSLHNLNPHFFAYGQFPLYLTFFTQSILNFITNQTTNNIDFSQAIISLRVYSAIFSCLTVLVFWFFSKLIFKQKIYRYILMLFIIFSPGLIQLAHFGTTESLLIFIFSLSLYYAVKVIQAKKISNKQLLLCAIFLGVGIASKIIAVIFVLPIFISLIILFLENKKNRLSIIKKLFLFSSLTLFFSCLFSPYNILSFNEFISSMKYETGVATGKIDVFYTRQFVNSVSYLFQINKVFPFALGLPIFIFSIAGIFLTKYKKTNFILIFSFLIYFTYSGQLFIKWFRFMSPLFPILIIFAVYFLQKIKAKFFLYILVLISIIPGIIFFNQVYLKDDNRITADNWIQSNIPANSHILSEDRNVIPLPISNIYQTVFFNFYDLDSNQALKNELVQEIFNTNYILVPSRRVYKNHTQIKYPITFKYYESLFNETLGFKRIAQFYSSDSIFLNSNNAEETFSVFDHPQILIFKKDQQFSVDQYKQILNI